jgi:glycosyltransferase involved in cell wall biosynthesis
MAPRVLMLGWEFPPFITGGLGTACFGLTKALDRLGVNTTFVLPKSTPEDDGSHVRLISPGDKAHQLVRDMTSEAPAAAAIKNPPPRNEPKAPRSEVRQHATEVIHKIEVIRKQLQHIRFVEGGPTASDSVYDALQPEVQALVEHSGLDIERLQVLAESGGLDLDKTGELLDNVDLTLFSVLPEAGPPRHEDLDTIHERSAQSADYSGNLFSQAEQYARFCSSIARAVDFDVIHAHDWLTYPAGLAVSRLTGKPLVVHVHSTEFDRSGEHVNQPVYNIERRGMHGATRVIAVSHLTKNIVVNRYGISPDKVTVVWNGVDLTPGTDAPARIESRDKLVLYFGRITLQKGPEFFIAAAKRVLEIMPDVKFVVAGSGDLAERMIRMAAELGIGHKVLFTGFLRGKDIERVFSIADLYVMPSVSEPFGIAPLEAMSHDVPVLISRNSGVSEVLTHALKCDFWDVDEMANKIIAVLRHSPLSNALKDGGRFELRRITWDGAAKKCEQVYEDMVAESRA